MFVDLDGRGCWASFVLRWVRGMSAFNCYFRMSTAPIFSVYVVFPRKLTMWP